MEVAVLLIIAFVVYLWWKGKIIFNFKKSKFNNSSKIVIEKEIQIGSQTKEVLISLKLEEPITVSTSQEEEETYDSAYAPRNDFHLNYWQDFMEYLEKCGTSLRIPKATNRGFQTFPIRGGAFTLYGMIKTGFRQITVEIYVKSEREFEMLKQNKESIDNNFAHELQWIPLPERKNTSAKIILINNSSPKEVSQREEQFAWLKENLEKFNDVFGSTRY